MGKVLRDDQNPVRPVELFHDSLVFPLVHEELPASWKPDVGRVWLGHGIFTTKCISKHCGCRGAVYSDRHKTEGTTVISGGSQFIPFTGVLLPTFRYGSQAERVLCPFGHFKASMPGSLKERSAGCKVWEEWTRWEYDFQNRP